MTNTDNRKNQEPHGLGNLAQINRSAPTTREVIEEIIDALDGANLTATVKTLSGIKRGSYHVTIKQDSDWNEVQVRLWESGNRNPIATGFIDRGHTNESRFEAAAETRATVRAYLCR